MTLKAKVRSKVVKATAASKYIRMPSQKICDDLEDLSEGECSEEEYDQNLSREIATRAFDQEFGGAAPRAHATCHDQVDDRIRQEIIGETIAKTMKQLMMEGCLVMDNESPKKKPHRFNKGLNQTGVIAKQNLAVKDNDTNVNKSRLSMLELTIYERAVGDVDANEPSECNPTMEKRVSTSSEEAGDTSDEMLMVPPSQGILTIQSGGYNVNESINSFLGAVRREVRHADRDEPQPGPSGYRRHDKEVTEREPTRNEDYTPTGFADKTVRDAELAKAKIFEVPGMLQSEFNMPNPDNVMVHSMMVDEKYMSVASHIDVQTKTKIIEGQYIDFAKLVLRDKIISEEDNRVQLVMHSGGTYFVPAKDNSTNISGLGHWDQAFRVYSDVYCKAHPCRATELIQYSHVIHTAASAYIWDNVYLYDKDFRLHMAENPGRSWSIILQQAWSMRLRDRLQSSDHVFLRHGGNGGDKARQMNPKDFCRRFNQGRCTFGKTCRYKHRCTYCFKFGHGFHNCRKAAADQKEKEASAGGGNDPKPLIAHPTENK